MHAARIFSTLLLLGLGLALWLIAVLAERAWPDQIAPAAALLIAAILIAIPPARRRLQRLVEHPIHPTPRTRFRIAAAITLLSFLYLAWTAHRQGRYLGPHWHDEQSYLLQAHMIALEGRLWMPPHAVGEFFESIFVLSTPVYASIYFPGTALALTPGVWLGLPTCVLPLLITSLAIGFAYRIITELTDGLGGLLAALLMLGTWVVRMFSTMPMSHPVLLLLALMMVWACLRFRRHPTWRWALVIGILSGWAAITRPLDALCYAVPIGVAMFLTLRGRPPRAWIAAACALLIGAAPFLFLQASFNKALTGSYASLPWNLYNSRHFPQTTFGFHTFNPNLHPDSLSPHKHAMHAEYGQDMVSRHSPAKLGQAWLQRRIPNTLEASLPSFAFALLLPLGFAAAFTGRRWLLALPIPLYLLGYIPWVYYSFYYAVVLAPAMALLVILGIDRLASLFPAARTTLRALLILFVILLCITQLPEARPRHRDHAFEPALTRHFEHILAQKVRAPALVLVRFTADRRLHEQLMTNWRHPRLDEAPILLAHDLDDRNIRLFAYYAARQPHRRVYRFDEATGALTDLGPVTDLPQAPIIKPPLE